jgi:hypothetical protein
LVLYYANGFSAGSLTSPGWTNIVAGEPIFSKTIPQPGLVTVTGSISSGGPVCGILAGIANGTFRQARGLGWPVNFSTTQTISLSSNVSAGSTIAVFLGYSSFPPNVFIPYIGISDNQNNIYQFNTSCQSRTYINSIGGFSAQMWAEFFTTVTSAAGPLTLTLTTPTLYDPSGSGGNIHIEVVEVTNPLPPVFTPSFRNITFADLPGFVNGRLQPSAGGTGANLAATGGAHQVLQQTSAGAAITVGQLAAADLSNGVTGSGAVVLAGSPTLTGTVALPIATLTGKVANYNNINTVSNGVPSEYATVDNVTATANIGATPLYAVPASGLYRLSYYVIVNRVATTSSILPDLQLTWTDQDNFAVQTFGPVDLPAGTGAGQSGANTLTTMYQGSVVISAKASTNIQYQTGVTTAYASSGATTMQYSVRLKLEAL